MRELGTIKICTTSICLQVSITLLPENILLICIHLYEPISMCILCYILYYIIHKIYLCTCIHILLQLLLQRFFFLLFLMGLHKLMEIQVLKNKWNKIVIISNHNKMYNSVFFIILSKLRKHIFISIDYKCFYEMTKYINILPKFRNLYYLLQHFLVWKWEKDKVT